MWWLMLSVIYRMTLLYYILKIEWLWYDALWMWSYIIYIVNASLSCMQICSCTGMWLWWKEYLFFYSLPVIRSSFGYLGTNPCFSTRVYRLWAQIRLTFPFFSRTILTDWEVNACWPRLPSRLLDFFISFVLFETQRLLRLILFVSKPDVFRGLYTWYQLWDGYRLIMPLML